MQESVLESGAWIRTASSRFPNGAATGSHAETSTLHTPVSVHLWTHLGNQKAYRRFMVKQGVPMLARLDAAAEVTDRPYNNLLRRLDRADFALLEPRLAQVQTRASDLLYSPGANVETVYFPCGPCLVSYVVSNEDGRDVETIL